jgi:hypothetical protein
MANEGFVFCAIVRDVDLADEIVSALMEAGASGVTILDSRGLSKSTFHRYAAELSIAAFTGAIFSTGEQESRLLFCIVKDAAQLEAFCAKVAEAAPNIDRPGSVIHFAVPASHLRGLSG